MHAIRRHLQLRMGLLTGKQEEHSGALYPKPQQKVDRG